MTSSRQVRRRDAGIFDSARWTNRDFDLDHPAETRIHAQPFGFVATLYFTRVTQSDESHVYIGTDAVGFDGRWDQRYSARNSE